jgi:hypothetical protein
MRGILACLVAGHILAFANVYVALWVSERIKIKSD